MSSATVTSKGQVTIPVEVRHKLGLHTGSRIAFVPTQAGTFEIQVEAGSVRDLKGIVRAPGVTVTLEEMDEAIAAGATSSVS